MKKITFFITIIIYTYTFAQDKSSLASGSRIVYDATVAKNFDKVTDMAYPRLFEVLTKEELKSSMEESFEDAEIFPVDPNFEFSEIKTVDNIYFCLITHDLSFSFPMEVKKETEETVLKAMRNKMKTRTVKYNRITKKIEVFKKHTLLAIADKSTNNQWTYMNYDEKKTYFLPALFGQGLAQKILGEFGQ